MSSLGMILYWTGSLIRTINDQDNVDIDIPDWFSLEFAGAFLALLFWVCIYFNVFSLAKVFSVVFFRPQF